MDDINNTLSEILKDENSVAALKNIAEQLLKGEGEPDKGPSVLDGIDMAKLAGTLSMINKKPNDSRINLLMSLKPYLSENRQKRLDSAVKILRLYSVIPLLKETNLLGGLLGD